MSLPITVCSIVVFPNTRPGGHGGTGPVVRRLCSPGRVSSLRGGPPGEQAPGSSCSGRAVGRRSHALPSATPPGGASGSAPPKGRSRAVRSPAADGPTIHGCTGDNGERRRTSPTAASPPRRRRGHPRQGGSPGPGSHRLVPWPVPAATSTARRARREAARRGGSGVSYRDCRSDRAASADARPARSRAGASG